MTFELLTAIALLCREHGRFVADPFNTPWKCQTELIKCVELSPTPMKLVQCMKESTK